VLSLLNPAALTDRRDGSSACAEKFVATIRALSRLKTIEWE